MRIAEKMKAVSNVARELQSRYTFDEIITFLSEFGISAPSPQDYRSKWTFSKDALRGVSDNDLARMAGDLDLQVSARTGDLTVPPANWEGTRLFRLFISHISKNKDKATRLKEALQPFAISGFVAHEDITPTLEWQDEIERGLRTMDAFLAIHTEGFKDSAFCQQEVGFALGRGAKVISLEMGEQPAAFIARKQSLPRRNRTAEEIAAEIDGILKKDGLTADRLASAKEWLHRIDDDIPF